MGNISLSQKEILTKLALIEKHLRHRSLQFYTPTYPYLGDMVNVQKEATLMLKFVGLEGYTPLITFTKTGDKQAGNIELDNSKNVFIEISDRHRLDTNKILAIMAHEICHKVLYLNGLYFSLMPLENEILTDLATVYVGFGKLSLNGCYRQYTTTSTKIENGQNVKYETEHTEEVGYLNLATFATAYCITCDIFNLPSDVTLNGLNKHALEKVHRITSQFRGEVNVQRLKDHLKYSQLSASTTFNSIVVLEEMLRQLRLKLKSTHTKLRGELIDPFASADDNLSGYQFNAFLATENCKYDCGTYSDTSKILAELTKSLINCDETRFDMDKIQSLLKHIECPNCGYVNSSFLKENRSIFVKCPKCGHVFLWDANEYYNQSVEDTATKEEESPKKKTFFFRIFGKS